MQALGEKHHSVGEKKLNHAAALKLESKSGTGITFVSEIKGLRDRQIICEIFIFYFEINYDNNGMFGSSRASFILIVLVSTRTYT